MTYRGRGVGSAIGFALVVVILAALGGCGGLGDESSDRDRGPQTFPGLELRLGGLDDPALIAAVAAQRGEWVESREATLNVNDEPIPLEDLDPDQVDVLVFPADRFGDLVEAGYLGRLPLDEGRSSETAPTDEEGVSTARDNAQEDLEDVVPLVRDVLVRYGNERLALPLGGSALVLVYRGEIFEDEALGAEAEASGIAFKPPSTWADCDALVEFLSGRDLFGLGEPTWPLAVPLRVGDGPGADPLAAQVLWGRASAVGLHRDQIGLGLSRVSLEPRLAGPPFVESLTRQVTWAALAPTGNAESDGSGDPASGSSSSSWPNAEAARRAFRTGRAAMLIDRAEMAIQWANRDDPFTIDVVPLPAARRVYDPSREEWDEDGPSNRVGYLPGGGGWLIGLSSRLDGQRRAAALDLLNYLTSQDLQARLLLEDDRPMLPVRSSLLNNGLPKPRAASGVDGRTWAIAIQQAYLAPRVVMELRIPQIHEFETELYGALGRLADELPRDDLDGPDPERVVPALENVVQAWADRIEEFGAKRMAWHYQASLPVSPSITTVAPPTWQAILESGPEESDETDD